MDHLRPGRYVYHSVLDFYLKKLLVEFWRKIGSLYKEEMIKQLGTFNLVTSPDPPLFHWQWEELRDRNPKFQW